MVWASTCRYRWRGGIEDAADNARAGQAWRTEYRRPTRNAADGAARGTLSGLDCSLLPLR